MYVFFGKVNKSALKSSFFVCFFLNKKKWKKIFLVKNSYIKLNNHYIEDSKSFYLVMYILLCLSRKINRDKTRGPYGPFLLGRVLTFEDNVASCRMNWEVSITVTLTNCTIHNQVCSSTCWSYESSNIAVCST